MKNVRKVYGLSFVLLLAIAFGGTVWASHSWGNYHWARTANPFTLKLGDNVSGAWDTALAITSSDWSQSTVLDTTIVPGLTTAKRCRPTSGRVEVCNSTYGSTGWLGVAQIWINSNHITQGTVKLNDTYFNTPTYNTTAWRNLVSCQEVGHTFGLNHQDENFNNAPLGTCMDYTSDPTPNQHPNAHDYDQLVSIYSHLDSFTTLAQTIALAKNNLDAEEWGALQRNTHRPTSVIENDLGNNEKLVTFIFWTE